MSSSWAWVCHLRVVVAHETHAAASCRGWHADSHRDLHWVRRNHWQVHADTGADMSADPRPGEEGKQKISCLLCAFPRCFAVKGCCFGVARPLRRGQASIPDPCVENSERALKCLLSSAVECFIVPNLSHAVDDAAVAVGLLDSTTGADMLLVGDDEPDAAPATRVLQLTEAEQTFELQVCSLALAS